MKRVKVRLWATTDKVGSKVERIIDVTEWDWHDMSEKERDKAMFEEVQAMFEWGYEEVQ